MDPSRLIHRRMSSKTGTTRRTSTTPRNPRRQTRTAGLSAHGEPEHPSKRISGLLRGPISQLDLAVAVVAQSAGVCGRPQSVSEQARISLPCRSHRERRRLVVNGSEAGSFGPVEPSSALFTVEPKRVRPVGGRQTPMRCGRRWPPMTRCCAGRSRRMVTCGRATPTPCRGRKVREIKATEVAVDGYGDASSREGFSSSRAWRNRRSLRPPESRR